ncbi:hypothetical protein [Paenibacillus sp. 481]|uniref:hypothetical protein n=1 Tax=Paenibacillus sp. 481 TaxID=2835869 RepID=UPI001E628181|nr:hypothetical protein [Paenibacillus sp. 481]UHA74646.1 hypothetical protein KIK04_06060 [Paenibacillus sp. 481]
MFLRCFGFAGVACAGCVLDAQRTAHSAQRTAHNAQRTTHSAQRTAHNAQRTTHSAQRTAHNAQRTTHSAQRTAHNAQRTTLRQAHHKLLKECYEHEKSIVWYSTKWTAYDW